MAGFLTDAADASEGAAASLKRRQHELIQRANRNMSAGSNARRVLHPPTWTETPSCCLENLFVDPGHRGSGVGRGLIDDLLQICRSDGWGPLYWHTGSCNASARRLYDRYVDADEFVRYRIAI